MQEEQLERRRQGLTPLEIIMAIGVFGVIVALGVLMMGHLPV